jgi:Flp pilus assembly pilin Flp
MELKRDDGQATVEHLGLVAIIALVLVSATAIVAAASPSIRNRVTTQFLHALCVVTGGGCQIAAEAPCPELLTVKTTAQGVTLGFIRLGHDQVLSIERRSDGTYAMSLLEGVQAGVGLSSGADDGGASLSAEAAAMLGGRAGRTFTAATPEEARALVHRLRHDYFPTVNTVVGGAADLVGLAKSDPSVESYVLAGDGAIDAVGKFGLGNLVEGGVKGRLKGQIGVRIAAHEQAVTVYQQLDGSVGAFFTAFGDLTAPLGRPGGGKTGGAKAGGGVSAGVGGGKGPGRPSSSLTVSNPLAQQLEGEVVAGGSLALKFGPGPTLQSIDVTGYAGTGSRRKEVHVTLDPSDPRIQEALRAWRSSPTSPAALAGLGSAAADRSAIDVRTFDTSSSDHTKDAELSLLGLGIGGSFGSEGNVSKLVEQQSKPVGGVWAPRLDCVTTASVRRPSVGHREAVTAIGRGTAAYLAGPSTSGVPEYARSSASNAASPTAFARVTASVAVSPARSRLINSSPTDWYAALTSDAAAIA